MSSTPDSNLATSPRILVVDDDPINRHILFVLLGNLGFPSDPAENGEEALELLRQNHYSLVFMDCQMPDMDGCTVTRLLRDPASAIKNPALPVIALTALSLDDAMRDCLQAGMNDVLIKPITSQKLSDTMSPWLKKPGSDSLDKEDLFHEQDQTAGTL